MFQELITLWIDLAPKNYQLLFEKYDDRLQDSVGLCDPDTCVVVIDYWHVCRDDVAEVIDTLFHEVAHAWTPGHAHDSAWAEKAISLGADPNKILPFVT